MSSSEAQKSPVHATTDDSTTEPTSGAARGGKTRPDAPAGGASAGASPRPRPDPDNDIAPRAEIGGGPGAGDGSSGGGAGAGIPGGGTDMRTDGAFSGGDVEEDRKKLFPEARTHRDDDTKVGTDPDESSYGGPLNLDERDG